MGSGKCHNKHLIAAWCILEMKATNIKKKKKAKFEWKITPKNEQEQYKGS